jgi:hypothetical protein
VAFAMVVSLAAGGAGCGGGSTAPGADAARSPSFDALGPSADVAGDSAAADAPGCPASCDDKNDCTIDSCDPVTFQCVHAPVVDGTSCQGRPCTTNSVCQGGSCLDGPYKTCTASDQCHIAGVCDPGTGKCTNPNSLNGKPCDDGLKCTAGDQCLAGVCQGTPFCPSLATCDPDTGFCHGAAGQSVFPTAVSAQVFPNVEGPTKSNGLVRTPDGQIFVAGNFTQTTDLGSGPVTTESPSDPSSSGIFIAKLDPSTDRAIWTKSFLGSQTQPVTAFAANGSGQLGLVGSVVGDMTVGDAYVLAPSGDQYILAASSTDGGGMWVRGVKMIGSNSQSTGLRGIAGSQNPRPRGAAFVVCGTADQNGTDLSPSLQGKANWQGGTDIVLAGLDGATGDTLWAAQVGGENDEDCAAVAMDGQSNTYVAGTYRFGSVVTLGDLPALPMVGDTKTVRMFVAKLGPQDPDSVADAGAQGPSRVLSAVWAVPLGEAAQTIVPSTMLALDPDVVVAGSIASGAPSLNGVALPSGVFIARLNGSTGGVVWIKGMGNGGGSVKVTAMAAGANGGLILTGGYASAFTLGTTALPDPNLGEATFVVQLDSNGEVLAAKGFGLASAYHNEPVGVVGLMGASGDELGGSLLLMSFTKSLDLGPPVGLVSTSSASTICASTLAP